MNDQENAEVAVLLSRGTQLANQINSDWVDELSNGVDQEDAVSLAEVFISLRDLLITVKE